MHGYADAITTSFLIAISLGSIMPLPSEASDADASAHQQVIDSLHNQIRSVCQLLSLPQLSIPDYQRPYRWSINNIAALFNDLTAHCNKSAYRLGSIVFHYRESEINDGKASNNKKAILDIVDGQQRTLTLMLTVKAIIDQRIAIDGDTKKERQKLSCQYLTRKLEALKTPIEKFFKRQMFSSRDSAQNLRRNYFELCRRVADPDHFTEAHIYFLLNRCEVACFVLQDISEAFQFFDAQNARGRDLAPHDLLKAFHLREFVQHKPNSMEKAVEHWERLSNSALSTLFADYLYRVRQWSEGKSARYFGKDDIGLFKGITIEQGAHFPYAESLCITHNFVDNYNKDLDDKKNVDCDPMKFPFTISQPIINGRRFFEMVEHYHSIISAITDSSLLLEETTPIVPITLLEEKLTPQASKILSLLNRYPRRFRKGDRYVRSLFDCALLLHIDKFGRHSISQAIEICFIWAYRCRIRQRAIQLATIDKYVLNYNLIQAIHDAITPQDLRLFTLRKVHSSENKNNAKNLDDKNEDEIVTQFKEMHCYE